MGGEPLPPNSTGEEVRTSMTFLLSKNQPQLHKGRSIAPGAGCHLLLLFNSSFPAPTSNYPGFIPNQVTPKEQHSCPSNQKDYFSCLLICSNQHHKPCSATPLENALLLLASDNWLWFPDCRVL